MLQAVAQTTRGHPRRAVPVAATAFPAPPASVFIRAAVDSLRARLIYVHDVLGLRIELVAKLANLSHKALRNYRLETWNPSLSTLLRVEPILDRHLPAWIEDKRTAAKSAA
jgi:predicted transcriptional regulator